MNILENEITIKNRANYLKLKNGREILKITSSKLVFQEEDHSITIFKATLNEKDCQIVINCGLNPPQIFFEYIDKTEIMEIDHDFQKDVIDALKKMEMMSIN